MLTDNRYILESFEKNFSDCKNKKIVLYGKGPFTKLILDIVKGYNIVGIMDRDIKDGTIYNMPVLSYKEIIEQDVELIIVVSRPSSLEYVFRRIQTFCSMNHIGLYAISGENLFTKFRTEGTDDEDVVTIFKRNFSECKNKRIVLYGKGPRTRIILENLSDYNIIGIMDRNLKEGGVYGKKILSYDEVLEKKADMIISVTRSWSTPHVYNRIGTFCEYNHIMLYDIDGNNLFETMGKVCEEVEPDPYFNISEKSLKQQILLHDVISFDVFDTLVMRKTLIPTDVFYIIEERAKNHGICIHNYHDLRKKAEADIIQKNPNIYNIYDHLQELVNMSDKDKEWLLQEEIKVEKEVLIQRTKMVEMMEFAIANGKRVCLISDMYLPETILRSILDGLNIKGYEKLYVSCDYNIAKWNGIFEVFKRQIKGRSYLHIGDNPIADGDCAKQFGINSFCIKKALDLLDISSYASIRSYLRTVNERSLIGLFIAEAFNNPFVLYHTDGRIEVEDLQKYGYLFIGALITDFVLWAVKQLKTSGCKKVLFAARDGFLIKKLYDQYCKIYQISNMPQSLYFYTSRHVLINASMETEEDIRFLMELPYRYSPDQMLINKFGFSKEEILLYDEQKFKDKVEYGLAHKELIFKRSKELKEKYKKYIALEELNSEDIYAFFDLVASGTCQYYLERMDMLNLRAYYLCYYSGGNPVRDRLVHNERSYIKLIKNGDYTDYIQENNTHQDYWLLETIMTSEEPSLIDVTEAGKPILGSEARNEEELEFVRSMHKAIERFFEEYIRNLYIDSSEIAQVIPDKLYGFKNLKYTYEHCPELDQFALFEDLGQGVLYINRH